MCCSASGRSRSGESPRRPRCGHDPMSHLRDRHARTCRCPDAAAASSQVGWSGCGGRSRCRVAGAPNEVGRGPTGRAEDEPAPRAGRSRGRLAGVLGGVLLGLLRAGWAPSPTAAPMSLRSAVTRMTVPAAVSQPKKAEPHSMPPYSSYSRATTACQSGTPSWSRSTSWRRGGAGPHWCSHGVSAIASRRPRPRCAPCGPPRSRSPLR